MNNIDLVQQTLQAVIKILEIVIPLGGLFYGFYRSKLNTLVESKIDLIKDEKQRKLVKDAYEKVEGLLDTEITSAETTAKPLILQKIANGELSKDSLLDIGKTVANTVISQLPDKTKDILNQEVVELEAYINSRLEERLGVLKLDQTSPVSHTEIPVPTIDVSAITNENAQLKSDKEALNAQLNQVVSDKANVEQSNSQLVQQLAETQNEIQNIKAKYDAIVSVVSPVVNQPVQQ